MMDEQTPFWRTLRFCPTCGKDLTPVHRELPKSCFLHGDFTVETQKTAQFGTIGTIKWSPTRLALENTE